MSLSYRLMSRRLPSLSALRAFEAAARHASFTRAAGELHVTQSAVSRHIRGLESELGVPLFLRIGRSVELTTDGERYFSALRDSFDRIAEATQRLRVGRESRVLTVDVLPTLASRWLIPRLALFSDAHHGIEVRMITSIRPVDFAREDIDLAIRVGVPPGQHSEVGAPRIDLVMAEDWDDLRADPLFPDVLVSVCNHRLLEREPPLRCPDDLRRHVLLHTASRRHAWPDWLCAVGCPDLRPRREISYGHFFMTMQAASEGRGVAIVPEILAANDLSTGNLVMPLPMRVPSAGSYYLLHRGQRARLEKVKVFRNWILDEASKEGKAVRG
jgi:LysR family glycine cleavage system transcriptional activator